jgi:hypothetical protein
LEKVPIYIAQLFRKQRASMTRPPPADHNACEVCWYHSHSAISDPETSIAIIPRVHRRESWGNQNASVIIYPNSKALVVNGTLYRDARCGIPRRIISNTQWEQALCETTDFYVSWDIARDFEFAIEGSDGMFHLPGEALQVYSLFEVNVIKLQKCVRRRRQQNKQELFKTFAELSHIRLGNEQLECIRRVCGIEDIMRNIFNMLLV